MSDQFKDLVDQLRAAAAAPRATPALRKVLQDSFAKTEALADAIAATDEDEVLLFEDDDCSIWSCRFGPDVVMPPHEHRMAVHLAVYRGAEVEVLYHRGDGALKHAQNRVVSPGEVVSLGKDAVHAVTAEGPEQSHAIHVYEGPLMQISRSLFDWDSGAAVEFTMDNFHKMVRQKSGMTEFDAPAERTR